MDRRSFLRGIAAVGACSLVPIQNPLAANIPVIYSDGVRCDSAGLEAMFNGLEFLVDPESTGRFSATDEQIVIENGNFRTSRTVQIPKSSTLIIIRNSSFWWLP